MSIYRVDKTELPVVVFQADGSVMKGVVFLSAATYSPVSKQTLHELMKEAGDFFPFRRDAGKFWIANKQTITHIRYEPRQNNPEQHPLGHREDVDVKFVGGEQLTGTVTIEMPAGKSRLFDFINALEGFFMLQNQEAHYLVNVRQIRDINPRL